MRSKHAYAILLATTLGGVGCHGGEAGPTGLSDGSLGQSADKGQSAALTQLSGSRGLDAASFAPAAKVGDERVYKLNYRGTAEVDLRLLAGAMAKMMGTGDTAANAHAGGSNGAATGALSAASLTPQLTHQRVGHDLSATLHSRVVAVDETGYITAARLQQVAYVVDGATDSRRELLETPFLMTFERTGALRKAEFPKQFPDVLRRSILGLVEPLQVVTGEPGQKSWLTKEREGESVFRTRYEVGATHDGIAELKKTRVDLLSNELTAMKAALPSASHTRIEKSATTIAWSVGERALERMTATERMSTLIGKAPFSTRDGVFTAERVTAPLAALGTTLAEATTALHDPKFARARMYEVDKRYAGKIAGLDARTAVTAFRAATAKMPIEGHGLIKNYARLKPTACVEISRELDTIATDEHVGFGWSALAAAGHIEAQTVLASVIADASFKPDSREKALIAVMDVEMPEPFLLDAVWKIRGALTKTTGLSSMAVSIA
ncbi:MAG: hypothetical protein EXR75_16555, partial [Myxococcales bacterium]|nr:hypothetical protein [Myxococcales bacterium]